MKEKKRLTVHHLIATPHRHKNWAVIVESGCCVVNSKNGRWIRNGLHVVVPKTKLYNGREEGEAFLKLRACI